MGHLLIQFTKKKEKKNSEVVECLVWWISQVHDFVKVDHKLIGYCDDDEHLALIYEFVGNGNLQDHLSGKKRTTFFFFLIIKLCKCHKKKKKKIRECNFLMM